MNYADPALNAMVDAAVDSVPYYRVRYERGVPFSSVKPISRSDVSGNEEQFLRADRDRSRLIEVETSGTTGRPLVLRQSPAERAASAVTLWRERRRHAPVTPADPYCRFYGYTREDAGRFDYKRIIAQGRLLQFSMFATQPDDLDAYIDALRTHQPTWFQAMPSLMRILADRVLERKVEMPRSLQLIELTGELLLATDRARIAEAFPNASIADRYAASEVWGIGYSCPAGGIHVMEANVHVEVGQESGPSADLGNGEILVTSRQFKTMPLLRYRLGDIVTVEEAGCPCNRETRMIRRVDGRSIDFAIGLSGEYVYPAFFNVVVAKCNWHHPESIAAFQVVQDADSLIVRLQPGRNWSAAIPALLRGHLGLKFEADAISFEVGELQRHSGRKFRVFERL